MTNSTKPLPRPKRQAVEAKRAEQKQAFQEDILAIVERNDGRGRS